jgi:hypothetical protein
MHLSVSKAADLSSGIPFDAALAFSASSKDLHYRLVDK